MKTQRRKTLLRNAIAAYGGGDPVPFTSLFDEAVRWTIIGDTAYSGTYEGMADLAERLFERLDLVLEGNLAIKIDNLIAEGDYVVVQGRGEATTKSGGRYDNTYCWVYRWSDDKIVEVMEYLDTELVTSALGS